VQVTVVEVQVRVRKQTSSVVAEDSSAAHQREVKWASAQSWEDLAMG
jgi:hypothetical protein